MYAAIGEKDLAFALLDDALSARESWLPNCRLAPGIVDLRDDPLFARSYRQTRLGHVDLSGPRIARKGPSEVSVPSWIEGLSRSSRILPGRV